MFSEISIVAASATLYPKDSVNLYGDMLLIFPNFFADIGKIKDYFYNHKEFLKTLQHVFLKNYEPFRNYFPNSKTMLTPMVLTGFEQKFHKCTA
ncbi:MAG: hypothetical protein LBL62_01710 [Planctomycetaceae bacterium]|jgi:hypothetical protein|nr:hypothetical protein [Planctomycetaceae bacterium]